jgi:hypothetical protein
MEKMTFFSDIQERERAFYDTARELARQYERRLNDAQANMWNRFSNCSFRQIIMDGIHWSASVNGDLYRELYAFAEQNEI